LQIGKSQVTDFERAQNPFETRGWGGASHARPIDTIARSIDNILILDHIIASPFSAFILNRRSEQDNLCRFFNPFDEEYVNFSRRDSRSASHLT